MEKKESLVFTEKPNLRYPYIICGLSGWVDGGEAATGSLKYLIRQLRARKFAEIPVSHYHVYQVPGADTLRPRVRMEDGLIAEHHLPMNQFFYAKNPASDHDIILFLGTEPNLNWEEYANTLVDVAREFQAVRLYILGGVLDETPHTREPKVSCSCNSAEIRDEIRKYNVTFSNREGPSTFNTTLLYLCRRRRLDAVSFSVRATYYPEFGIDIPYNPRSIKALLVRLNHLMRLDLSFRRLDDGIGDFQEKLEFVRSQNSQFHAYVNELEKNYVGMPYEEPLELSHDEAVRLAEDFLKENKDQH